MKKKISLLALFLLQCGTETPSVPFISTRQPYVSHVEFVESSEVLQWTVDFSTSMDSQTLTEENILVGECDTFVQELNQSWRHLSEQREEGDLNVPEQEVENINTHQVSIQMPRFSGEWCLLVLPQVRSQEHIPLRQSIFTGQTDYYLQSWSIDWSQPISDAETSISGEENNTRTDQRNNSSETEEEVEIILDPLDFSGRVWITEVVTDPQQDHNESSFGDGILFNAVVGAGAITSSDEYIELYNGQSESIDLTNWNLKMLDTTPVEESFSDSNLDLFFSKGGSLTAWEPGEILVLGDPTGTINNEIRIEIWSGEGELVDFVDIADANADSLSDEAYTLDEFGNWAGDQATPGEIDFLEEVGGLE